MYLVYYKAIDNFSDSMHCNIVINIVMDKPMLSLCFYHLYSHMVKGLIIHLPT